MDRVQNSGLHLSSCNFTAIDSWRDNISLPYFLFFPVPRFCLGVSIWTASTYIQVMAFPIVTCCCDPSHIAYRKAICFQSYGNLNVLLWLQQFYNHDSDEETVEHANLTLVAFRYFLFLYSDVFMYNYVLLILKKFVWKCLFRITRYWKITIIIDIQKALCFMNTTLSRTFLVL